MHDVPVVGEEGEHPAAVARVDQAVDRGRVDEPVDDAKRALVGALAAVALAAAPVADAMTEGGIIGNVDVAQLFELAGFGAPTGALDSPPLPEQQLKQILDLDERAALRKASLIRTGNYDVLLQVSFFWLFWLFWLSYVRAIVLTTSCNSHRSSTR